MPALSTRDVDIVTAYRELKKHMGAAIGTKINEDVTANKHYLKPTIAIQQHSKNRMNRELLMYSLAQSKSANPYLNQCRERGSSQLRTAKDRERCKATDRQFPANDGGKDAITNAENYRTGPDSGKCGHAAN